MRKFLQVMSFELGVRRKKESGFTLIEILVAISILAIIGAISIPNLSRFNDSQALQNTANDLVRVLREAQSGANSRIKCTNLMISRNWNVSIDNTADSYVLRNDCYNPLNAATQVDILYSSKPESVKEVDISGRSEDGNCGTTLVAFNSEYQPYAQNRFSNISFDCTTQDDTQLEIRLNLNSSDQYICIQRGGAIYVQDAVCF